MQAWSLAAPRPGAAHAALAAVIDAIGRPGFAAATLAALSQGLRAGSWSVYQRWSERPPRMHLSASHGVVDTTASCFATYRDEGLYRHDSSFDAVQAQGRPGQALMLRMPADEAPSAQHREAIYVRHGMSERLSVACLQTDGSLLAINLYRHLPHTGFGADEREHLAAVAPALVAAVVRHIEWTAEPPADRPRAALKRRCPTLTGRELDVLERILQGLSYDGIAADMGLGVATVKTYRMRAFDRLAIHSRNQLFAEFGALPRRGPARGDRET